MIHLCHALSVLSLDFFLKAQQYVETHAITHTQKQCHEPLMEGMFK